MNETTNFYVNLFQAKTHHFLYKPSLKFWGYNRKTQNKFCNRCDIGRGGICTVLNGKNQNHQFVNEAEKILAAKCRHTLLSLHVTHLIRYVLM